MNDAGGSAGLSSPSSTDSWRIALYVLIAGAVGGITWWVWQQAIGVQALGWNWYRAIPALVLLGGVAGMAGVYVLANSDTSSSRLVRTLIYALLCGVFWRPVLEAGGNLVSDSMKAAEAPNLQQKTSELDAAIESGDRAEIDKKLAELAPASAQVVELASKVSNPALRAKFMQESNQAIAAIQRAAPKAPERAVESLQDVGVAAAKSDETAVMKATINSLARVQRENPAIAPRAQEATGTIWGTIGPRPGGPPPGPPH
jgi:hypothetical protein